MGEARCTLSTVNGMPGPDSNGVVSSLTTKMSFHLTPECNELVITVLPLSSIGIPLE